MRFTPFLLVFLYLSLVSPLLAAPKAPIMIGATLALSGKLSFAGTAQMRGLQLAVDDINARGGVAGRELELIVEDNAGQPSRAVSGTLKLLTVEKVPIFFSAFTHITQAVKEPVADTPEIRKLYEKNQSVSLWYGFSESTEKPVQVEFISKFQRRYAEFPFPDAAFFYDDMMALGEALPPCLNEESVDVSCVARELREIDRERVSGRLRFGSSGVALRKVIAITIKDVKWAEVPLG